MARMLQLSLIVVLGFSMVGCVSADRYTAEKLRGDRLAADLATASSNARAQQAAADAYKQQLDALAVQGGSTAAIIQNLNAQLAAAQADAAGLRAKYEDAVSRAGNIGNALPQPLTNELNAFAQQNPDLVDFDSARGIVKFKSDVTFATGDAELTPKAKEVIDRFSAILNSQAASSYELLVAGHTDNQPVSNPLTKQKGHKDNWYLSAHRAIGVGSELIARGVAASRVGVAGYADQHPIAANTSEAGRAQNRRVEVLILPSTIRAGGGGVVAAAHKEKPSAKAVLNKDGPAVGTDSRALLNK